MLYLMSITIPLRPIKSRCFRLLSSGAHLISSCEIALSGKPFILRESNTTQSACLSASRRVLWIRRFELVVGDFISYMVSSIMQSADVANYFSLRRMNSTVYPARARASAVFSSCGQTLRSGAMIVFPVALT